MERCWTAEEIAPTLLPQIPIYDVGPNFPMELALRVGERAYDLLAMATAHVPRPVLRLADRLARRWLVQNNSPYLAEITALAQRSREPGLYYLNVQYEWGCTTAARPAIEGQSEVLLRALDWDIAGIGRFVVAARIANPLGAWTSLTWPAFTGVLQAMAPGRFAAAINQPTPPRFLGLSAIDRYVARRELWATPHIQPIHLLRRVFETASNFAHALEMLTTTPITTSTIFTLVGTKVTEAAVIERRPTAAQILHDAHAANEWRTPAWRRGHHRAYENDRRLAAIRTARPQWDLEWLTWPILNPETRVAMMADPATGRLAAQGFEDSQPATRVLRINSSSSFGPVQQTVDSNLFPAAASIS
jgi:hypothetical protein